MNIYMILLLVLVFVILNYIMNNKESLQENFAGSTDFFHRSFMSGLGLEERKKDLKKIYDFYKIKENFNEDTKIIDEMIEAKKLDDKVISKADKPSFELEDLKYDDQKHIVTEEVTLSDFVEVDDYNTGSGDLNKIQEVFDQQVKNDFKTDLKLLDTRGGNVHFEKKQ